MSRAILLALGLALVGGSAWAYTETFYLCATGDNSAPKDGTCAHAWNATGFNTAGNWAATDTLDAKIGPNDLVIVLDDGGAIMAALAVQQGGLSGKPITIQGEVGGTATLSGSRFKTGNWGGPDVNGVYTITNGGVANIIMRRDDIEVPFYVGKTSAQLTEDTYSQITGDISYKPLAGHNPNEYTWEIPARATVLSVVSHDYVTITGLQIRGATGTADNTPALLIDNSDHVIVTNNVVTFNTYDGISVDSTTGSCDDVLLEGNTVTWAGLGIRVNSGTNVVIRNNVVHDIGDRTSLLQDWIDREGIGVNGAGLTNNVLVEGNTVYNVGHDTAPTNNVGIFLYMVNGGTVQRNLVYNTSRVGIWVQDGSGAHAKNIAVQYNIVRDGGTCTVDNTGSGITRGGGIVLVQANSGGFSTGTTVYNNSVSNFGAGNAVAGKRGGIVYDKEIAGASAIDVKIKNNISTANITYDLGLGLSATAPTGLVLDYNLYYRATGNMVGVTGAGTTEYTQAQFATYKTDTGQDADSVSADPLVSSPSDFHLRAGSPAINAGVSVGLTQDFDGHSITGLPDLGAYEYGGCATRLVLGRSGIGYAPPGCQRYEVLE